MNKELQQLKDIHLPHAINMWPIAPGWLILFAILSVLSCYLGYRWYQRRLERNTVNCALSRLKNLQQLITANPDNINIAAEISTLIRRTALHYYRREDFAGLTGDDWLNFLNQSGDTTLFTRESRRLLIDAPYRKNTTPDLMPLIAATHTWLIAISRKQPLSAEK